MKVDREVSFEQAIAKFEQKIDSAEGKKSEIENLVNQFADKIDTNLDLCKLSNTRLLSTFAKIKHMTETSASLPIQSKVQKTFDKIIQSQQEGFKEELRVFIDRIKDEKGMIPSSLGSLNLEADINNLAQELKELLQTRENIDLLMQFGHEALLQDILFVCSLEPESDIARTMIRSCCEHDNPDAVRALVAQGVKLHEIAAAISIDTPKTKVTECIRKMVAESGGKIRSKKNGRDQSKYPLDPGQSQGKDYEGCRGNRWQV
ncbi:MAG: hypothetical protein BWZ03_00860 [bacterium ADurb.BinA186]|nr:MAG: hypothetical protein BWZ03_00860 [bacterium ADurb.BinA186]